MAAAPRAERLAMARSEVSRACNLLIAPTPQALSSCHEALRQAVAAMSEVRPHQKDPQIDPSILPVVQGLHAEIRRARQLLQNLASFYRGWERILGAMSGGYTANGNPAPVTRLGRVCCRG
jgi:hypothetical protein